MTSVTTIPSTAPAAGATTGAGKQPLDDIMLAMDVVDTLRRRERVVQRELDEVGREDDLKGRLRRIYSEQGIEVPDRVIEQGVAALKEERFTYKPPPDSLAIKLARLYVDRGRWGKWVGGIAGAGALAGGIGYFTLVAPDAALPDDLARMHTEVVELAATDRARQAVDQAFAAGASALRNEDTAGAREAMKRMQDLGRILGQEYTIRIVNRPGEASGVWRVPDANTQARNYYIIVEAVDPTGKAIEVPIESEETRRSDWVDVWGLRVSQSTFESVGRDKKDDGIIERDRFGYKARGALVPNYEMQTTGGAITKW